MTDVSNEEESVDQETNTKTKAVEGEIVEESPEEEIICESEENVEPLKKEEVDYKAKFYYMAAEMDNLQKRHTREREKLLKFGNEKILSSLLDVVDNLDRTIEASASEEDEKVKNIMTGINMVQSQFLTVLKSNGLEEVKTVGEIFDPNFHEALAQQPAEGKEEEEILSEFQKGYVLNGRLLRAAKVVVTKNN